MTALTASRRCQGQGIGSEMSRHHRRYEEFAKGILSEIGTICIWTWYHSIKFVNPIHRYC